MLVEKFLALAASTCVVVSINVKINNKVMNCPEMCALFHPQDQCAQACSGLGAPASVGDTGCQASDWPCIVQYMAGLVAQR